MDVLENPRKYLKEEGDRIEIQDMWFEKHYMHLDFLLEKGEPVFELYDDFTCYGYSPKKDGIAPVEMYRNIMDAMVQGDIFVPKVWDVADQ